MRQQFDLFATKPLGRLQTILGIGDLGDEDCLPHDRAVWRSFTQRCDHGNRRVSVETDLGKTILCLMSMDVDWRTVVRWRYGWPPKKDRT